MAPDPKILGLGVPIVRIYWGYIRVYRGYRGYMGFRVSGSPKIRDTILEGPIIRIIVLGVYIGVPYFRELTLQVKDFPDRGRW